MCSPVKVFVMTWSHKVLYLAWKVWIFEQKPFNPQWEKTYLLACAPNEDSNQPTLPRSLISLCYLLKECFAPLAIETEPCEDSDRIARMRSLIWIFAGCTWTKVHFRTMRHIYIYFRNRLTHWISLLTIPRIRGGNYIISTTMDTSDQVRVSLPLVTRSDVGHVKRSQLL